MSSSDVASILFTFTLHVYAEGVLPEGVFPEEGNRHRVAIAQS